MPRRSSRAISHVGADGSIAMVDVSAKRPTVRAAVAEAFLRMAPAALNALKTHALKKGDALGAAQIAGTIAAKRTSELIPLCHPLALTHVAVRCSIENDGVSVRCSASCIGPTGVEMEAMTGATIAALTIYDMCKSADRGMTIERVQLIKKSGGKSGAYRRRKLE